MRAGLICPVAGPVSFTDDWGAPRSGGRTHKGNDLFARHGTPLVAIESGVITKASDADVGLGGITLWLTGDSGTKYYYAHNALNAVRLGERVQAGQIVAYVGNTGNAATTPPHVHFRFTPVGVTRSTRIPFCRSAAHSCLSRASCRPRAVATACGARNYRVG